MEQERSGYTNMRGIALWRVTLKVCVCGGGGEKKRKKGERVFHCDSGKEKRRTGGARQDLEAVLPQKESRRVLGTIC